MKYYLAEANQNTFVLLDCLYKNVDEKTIRTAHECLENEKRDDALILTEGSFEGDAFYARMMVVGLDGAFGEFCGNGSRACAAYLFNKYTHIQKFFLKTGYGLHLLSQHDEGCYSIHLPPARFELNNKFLANSELFRKLSGFQYVEMIEPHLIIEKEMSDEELLQLGRKLNLLKDIFPLGININAWHILKEGHIHVKTYERGVQRLTQSCGTGSMSCAAFYKRSGGVQVTTAGGVLDIQIHLDGIVLKGPASFDKDKKGI